VTLGIDKPRPYADMLATFQPRPIKTEKEAQRLQAIVDGLIDKPEPLTEDERQFMVLLGYLIEAWEAGKYELPAVTPLGILRSLIEDNELRQQDLVGSVFPTAGVASEVLHGKRRLTYDFVQRLAEYFHVSPALFFDATTRET